MVLLFVMLQGFGMSTPTHPRHSRRGKGLLMSLSNEHVLARQLPMARSSSPFDMPERPAMVRRFASA
jgi:hypothetical protein